MKAVDLQLFAQQYARPAPRSKEPNDRRYRRDIERVAKRMRPEDLDNLLRDEE